MELFVVTFSIEVVTYLFDPICTFRLRLDG